MMLKNIPYRTLKRDQRGYEIMLLRDQQGSTFADIAKECSISVASATQIYYKIKIKQIRLYMNHIAFLFKCEDDSQINEIYNNAYACYQDWGYACAYLEKKYNDILTDYRDGEPGMPAQFLKNMPPYKAKLSEAAVTLVVELRETKKMSFTAIGEELRITQAKARHTYEWFYHEKVMELVRALQDQAESAEEKAAIGDYYFRTYKTAKKRYDMLTKK